MSVEDFGLGAELRKRQEAAPRRQELHEKYMGEDGKVSFDSASDHLDQFVQVNLSNLMRDDNPDTGFDVNSEEAQSYYAGLTPDNIERWKAEEPTNETDAQLIAETLMNEQQTYAELGELDESLPMWAAIYSSLTDPMLAVTTAATLGTGLAATGVLTTAKASGTALRAKKFLDTSNMRKFATIGGVEGAVEGALYGSAKAVANDNYSASDAVTDTLMGGAAGIILGAGAGHLTDASSQAAKGLERMAEESVETEGGLALRSGTDNESEVNTAKVSDDFKPHFLRLDNFASGMRSLSPYRKTLTKGLLTNTIRKKGQNQGSTADLEAYAYSHGIIEKGNSQLAPLVHKLEKDRGLKLWHWKDKEDFRSGLQDEIYDLINKGGRSEIPEVNQMASILQDRFEETLNLAKRKGVKGTEDLEINRAYTPRMHSSQKRLAMEQAHGSDEVFSAYRNAILTANLDMPRAVADVITHGYMKKLGADGMDNMDDIFDNSDNLEEWLSDIIGQDQKFNGMSVPEYKDLMFDYFKLRREAGESGKKVDALDRLKSRMKMDIYAYSDNGSVRVRDMVDTNIFGISENYTRTLGGNAALAKHGLDSPRRVQAKRKRIAAEVEQALKGQGKSKGDIEKIVQKELDSFDDHLSLIKGQPIHFKTMTSGQKQAANAMLGLNNMSMLGMAGLAGMSEFMGAVFRGGLMTAVKSIPMTQTKDSIKLFDTLEGLNLTFGKQHFAMYFNQFEETGDYGMQSWMQRFVHYGNRATSVASLMQGFDSFARKSTLGISVNKSLELARSKGKLLFTKEEMGMDTATYKRVVDNLKSSAKEKKTGLGTVVDDIDFSSWEAQDIEAFTLGLYRMNNQQTLRLLAGERISFVDSSWGKFLFQFQTLLLSGIYKSLGNKVVNMQELHTWTTLMGEAVGASIWYGARQHIKAAGKEDKERNEYLQEHVYDPSAFVQGAIGYSGTFGGITSLWNLQSNITGLPTFGQRYSPATGSAIFNNPTVSQIEKAGKLGGNLLQAPFSDDVEIDDKTYMKAVRLLPLSSWYGSHFLNNKILNEIKE